MITGHAWPAPTYQTDPVRFARECLRVRDPKDPSKLIPIRLTGKQVDILNAIRDHKRVTVCSGHKVGKSMTAAIIALWFYCSFDDARVIMSSTTARQVDAILWREVRQLYTRAAKPIDGELHELARSGLKSTDFREIVGFTAKEAEAVAGVSGANLLYIVDEASGVPDLIFEAIEGNRAGGARIALFSNPTRTEGEFFRSHCDEQTKKFWHQIHVSSEDVVNEGIPGLAEQAWVELKREEWGEDSPLYKVRVKGEFVLGEDGKVLTLHAIGEAQNRWYETTAEGRLYVGLDPAGDGDAGDESVWAARRGNKIVELRARRGQSEDAHVALTLQFLRDLRIPREPPPVVVVDREGAVGARVYGALRAYADAHPEAFELLPVRASDAAVREPRIYGRLRDELWANLRQWLREGGAIPEDDKLARELHAPEWTSDIRGRQKVTEKKELRKALGRSPDRADAVALAVWDSPVLAPAAAGEHGTPDDPTDTADVDRTFDPYT